MLGRSRLFCLLRHVRRGCRISVLLSLAVTKSGDESNVLQAYRSASGRGKIENMIVGKLASSLQNSFSWTHGPPEVLAGRIGPWHGFADLGQ